MAISSIIAGDYKGNPFKLNFTGQKVEMIAGLFKKNVLVNKDTVESYELIDEEYQTSAASAVGRGLVGGALLGPVGLLAGLSAKKKGMHRIVINWKDGKRSLAEVDDKVYKALMVILF
ncbi:hypothetical protein NYE70_23565 [Paenibacillus sp. FSL R5-0407]|uniref:hypothetical protein n=1 Tax=Paenibacillus sp. FSL R5-0407 TaxID=2975320 RepID=UPI0030F7A314